MSEVNAEFPEKLQCLFTPARYKIVYGGRGGAKSWGVARALLLRGIQEPIRVLCCREFQGSIADSVHQLLSDQIHRMGLDSFYKIEKAYITGPGETLFMFEGIRHNIGKIRSKEGIDLCWVEEAETVSKSSWDVLIPTIRKENSEIWITFNPGLETDETYVRFIKSPPKDALVVKLNWRDNPWFPEVLQREMEDLKVRDYDAYLHVWEGQTIQSLEGAVYAEELRLAAAEGRITKVPYVRNIPVDTCWDLGRSDATAIWFAQRVGFQTRIIDYFEDQRQHIDYYIKELQRREYIYGRTFLPHDAKNELVGSKLTVEDQVRAKLPGVKVGKKIRITNQITAVRSIFPQCWFDEEKCADGISALRHYRYEVIGTHVLNGKQVPVYSKDPIHDWASHGASAFKELAFGVKEPRAEVSEKILRAAQGFVSNLGANFDGPVGWMR